MRYALGSILLSALALFGCKKKEQQSSDASALAQIFAATPDAEATAESDAASSVATDDPLPSLKPVTAPPPVIGGGVAKPTTSAASTSGAGAASAAGNPNLPQCITARAFCSKNHPDCQNKTQACLAAGGRM